MAYQSFPYMGFGRGLNLRDKPDAVDPSEAIDALNVSFTERGAIETRRGYGEVLAGATTGLGSFQNTGGSKRILTTNTVSTAKRLRAYATTGGSPIADSGALTNSTSEDTAFSFLRYGTPGSERVYASNGVDARYFDGTSFTAPQVRTAVGGTVNQAFPKATALALQSTENRMVATGFAAGNNGPNGATVSASHVFFSDPGDPETFLANNFVQLTPGDGEKVMGAATWREFLFVFKETKFFVFYGNSVDGTGEPIFNYRPVEGGVGLASRFGIATTPNGVYFVGADGLYRTTGSSAERVSDAVEPIWTGSYSPYYQGGSITVPGNTQMTSLDSVLFMSFTASGGTQRVLVHDTEAGWFSIYDLPAKAIHAFDGSIWFGGDGLYRHSRSFATDDGTPIAARWRSGWLDFGSPDVKVLRASKMWGRGRTQIGVSTDFDSPGGTFRPVEFSDPEEAPQWNTSTWGGTTWAIEANLRPKQRRRSERGTTFSVTIAGDAPWAVHRATYQLRQVRQPGIEDTASDTNQPS